MAYKIKKKRESKGYFKTIPEIKREIVEERKHPSVVYWGVELEGEDDKRDIITEEAKELWETIKGVKNIKKAKFIKSFTEAIKTMGLQKKRKK
jgi:hypothetical protein